MAFFHGWIKSQRTDAMNISRLAFTEQIFITFWEKKQ